MRSVPELRAGFYKCIVFGTMQVGRLEDPED
jgi:hypothetical protein